MDRSGLIFGRAKLFALVLTVLGVISVTTSIPAHGLQQVAGQISIEIEPGETKSFQWGLASDSDDLASVQLRAEGEGAEFMSYPDEVSIEPRQLVYVTVNVTVPADYPGDVQLIPAMYATQLGHTGGATVINIQMKKLVTLDIAANANPELRALKLSTFMHQVQIEDEMLEIAIDSSSTVSDFNFDRENKRISLKVTGPDGTEGVAVIRLGKVLEGPYSVTFDGQSTSEFETLTDQVTGEASIRLVYQHSTHDIVITGTNVVPEFLSALVISGAAIGTLVLMARKWPGMLRCDLR